MPIIDTQDARDLDSLLQHFFESNTTERAQLLRQLFTQKFDFNPATGKVSLANAPKNVTLPTDADRIASIEGIDVVYVPLEIPDTTRVRKAEAVAAARLIASQLSDDMLLLMNNQQIDGKVSQLHVILPTFTGATPALRRMVIERDLPRRTVIQQLSNIYHQWRGKGDLRLALEEAFNVEAVTSGFFKRYREVFGRVQELIKGFPETNDGREAKKLFAQTFFNRLMFIYFLSRKGWLKFKEDPDYLAALWKDYQKKKDTGNFYEERLKRLFFEGLNNPRSADLPTENPELYERIGDVPFLNGGLFDKTTDEIKRSDVAVQDEAIQAILQDLFEHYNFTVMESTPLDQEVAVDPEMLGKVFEELVTGRHESGSYYTPRPVVSFMCREALKGHLREKVTDLPTEAIDLFVDHYDVSKLNYANAGAVREALAEIKVVDPACGSGAYLLGMMHELVELETALYSEKLLGDEKSLYDLKLRIIEKNVYGADIDQFAVNVAMLRLWLSLTIDYESFPPPPLPNLDFKIVRGDSLTAPDPDPTEQNPQYEMFRVQARKVSKQVADLKHRYLMPGSVDKHQLYSEIETAMANLTKTLAFSPAPGDALDWRVKFSEVFDENNGFDIVLANPPYVRADAQFRHLVNEDERLISIANWKKFRAALFKSKIYQTLYEKWDLYLPFLERSYQLLSPKGRMVFIISDAYNSAKYTKMSHEFFLSNSQIERIDFCSDIPLFEAGVSNTIVHFTKTTPDVDKKPLRIRRWGESHLDFERNTEVLQTFSQKEVGLDVFRLDGGQTIQISTETVRLGDICYISWGMRPCSDERTHRGTFRKKDLLLDIQDNIHSKPFVEGKNMTKWWVFRERYLEWGTKRAPNLFARPTFPELYTVPEKLFAMDISGDQTRVAYDDQHRLCNNSISCCVSWHYLSNVNNRSIRKTARYGKGITTGKETLVMTREQLEELSRLFETKYLLGVMNSTYAASWFSTRRRSKFHLYPDDWKSLPIALATRQDQTAITVVVDELLKLFANYGYPLPVKVQLHQKELEVQIDKMVAKLYGLDE